jgi:hypothetical protein
MDTASKQLTQDLRTEIRNEKRKAELCDERADRLSVVAEVREAQRQAAVHRTRVKELEQQLVKSVQTVAEGQVVSPAKRVREIKESIAALAQKQKDCQRYLDDPERWLSEARRDRDTAAKLIKQAEAREQLIANAKEELISAHDRVLELRQELITVEHRDALKRIAELQAELAAADPELLALLAETLANEAA